MKKIACTFVITCMLLAGCAAPMNLEPPVAAPTPIVVEKTAAVSSAANADTLPTALLDTYYVPPTETVYTYLQNRSIKRFFNMWLETDIGKDVKATWNYDTLAPVQLLDHNFKSIAKSGTQLYTCTFSTDDGRCGYIIVSYNKDDPSIQKWSLCESPYPYDLRTNSQQIAAVLSKTDIDLTTASAIRVEWIDTEKNRGDRIILFTDGKNDRYVCYFGEDGFTIEKQ